jgi:hypothetical protein
LRQPPSPALVITAIVISALLGLFLGVGAISAYHLATHPGFQGPPGSVIPTIVWNALSTALNFAAGGVAIRALLRHDVQKYYYLRNKFRFGS